MKIVPVRVRDRVAAILTSFGNKDGCWNWPKSRVQDGYGQIGWKDSAGRSQAARAHRVAFEIHFGPIDDDLEIMHACDNPSCVNPLHLVAGTHQDNMRDMSRKQRSGAIRKPSALLRGDAHYSRRSPNLLARGERNGSYTHPENRPRGISHGQAKLSECDVRTIRASTESGSVLAAVYGVDRTLIGAIRRRAIWRHLV